MENDEPITPPTTEEAAALNQKWDDWGKKQNRGIAWQTAAGLTAVFGLIIAAGAATSSSNDKTPDCPADLDQEEMVEQTTPAEPLRDGSTITLKDGSSCIMRFTP